MSASQQIHHHHHDRFWSFLYAFALLHLLSSSSVMVRSQVIADFANSTNWTSIDSSSSSSSPSLSSSSPSNSSSSPAAALDATSTIANSSAALAVKPAVVAADFSFEVKEVYFYPQLINLFAADTTKDTLSLPGVTVKRIPCPLTTCPSLNVSVFPESLASVGYVCGVEISPAAPAEGASKTRIFLAPQFPTKPGFPEVLEGPRGLIATTSGLVFDIAGGCDSKTCQNSAPTVGTKIDVPGSQVTNVAPIVVGGLHLHSHAYFKTLMEIVPRISLVTDYITASGYSKNVSDLQVVIRSEYLILNGATKMLDWGLAPTRRVSKFTSDWTGSFILGKVGGYVEATSKLISPAPYDKYTMDTVGLITSQRKCITTKFIDYKAPGSCEPLTLPEKYVLVLPPTNNETKREVQNFPNLVAFLLKNFQIPIVAPALKQGCDFTDIVRFFRNAVGVISSHGSAFSNVNFMSQPGVVVQLVLPKPNPFHYHAIMAQIHVQSLGHKYISVLAETPGAPKWDYIYQDQPFIEKVCNKAIGKPHPFVMVWLPSSDLEKACSDYKNAPTAQ